MEKEPGFIRMQILRTGQEKTLDTLLPLFSFVKGGTAEKESGHFLFQVLEEQMPLAAYAGRDGFCLSTESMPEYEKLIRMEGMDEKYTGDLLEVEEAREEALLEENKKAAQQLMAGENMTETEGGKQDWKGAPTQKQVLYPLEEYQEYEKLIGEFYTIDPTTMADETLFNLDDLLKRDMTLKDPGDGPQILIYHTHSQEGFADSVPGDESMTVVGVGDYLTELLQERYGFKVLHHKGQYDVEKRDYAYAKAAPALEQLLKDNPSIQVVIDLHRDEVPEGTRLLTTLNGKPTARFMFFNGLSRTKKTGEIPYLENPYIEDNLAFAFQMQLACNEYYPGLTRKIYLKGYRYNMHYCPKTLLVELGAQTNTVEEAYNACEPLADMIAKVLLGEE